MVATEVTATSLTLFTEEANRFGETGKTRQILVFERFLVASENVPRLAVTLNLKCTEEVVWQ